MGSRGFTRSLSTEPSAPSRSDDEWLSVDRLVAARTAEDPHRVAVACEAERLTFGTLDARANRLAHHLRAGGVDVETPVGLLLPRSIDAVVAMLAILRAGGAYVPLDSTCPPARLVFMLEDAGVSTVVSRWDVAGALGHTEVERLVLLDVEDPLLADRPQTAPEVDLSPDNLAYLMYTSGSTGAPKAVAVTHANVLHLVRHQHYARFGPGRNCLAAAPVAFDASIFETWGPLCNGAAVVVLPERVPTPDRVRQVIDDGDVRMAFLTNVLFNTVVEDGAESLEGLDELLVGGEVMSVDHLHMALEALPGLRLSNVYGPTECTTFTTWFPVPIDLPREQPIPIGRPITGTTVQVLDEALQPVPDGDVGVLFVGGLGVARGYRGRPGLTAERFVPDPQAVAPGSRLYRTGDLARFLRDGALEFVGRVDHQVKVRGHRVELGEVEAALLTHRDVRQAVVTAVHEDSHTRLIAHVAGSTGRAPTAADLRRHLRQRLPDHMIPHHFVASTSPLPLTANGKIDRRALSELPVAAAASPTVEAKAPVHPAEEVLAAIWAEVLDIEKVETTDDFFALGGDSILSIRVTVLAEERGLTIPPGAVFSTPVLRDLARAGLPELPPVGTAPPSPFSLTTPHVRACVPSDVEDAYPMTALQTGMLFHTTFDESGRLYHDIVRYRFEMPWDEDAFRETVRSLVDRHELLRTTFDLHRYSEPMQLVRRTADVEPTFVDLRKASRRRASRKQDRFLRDAWLRPFDWTERPPLRLAAHVLAPEAFDVVVDFHHALLDGWSLALLIAELGHGYDARRSGGPDVLSPLRTSFARFVELERAAAASDETRAFWTARMAGVEPCRVTTDAADSQTTSVDHVDEDLRELEPDVLVSLRRLARRMHVPLKTLFLAAHAATVATVVQRDSVVTGVVSHGRPEEADGDRLLGVFLNVLPTVARVRGRTWEQLAVDLYDAERLGYPHRRYPLASMLQDRGEHLFDWVFNYTYADMVGGPIGAPHGKVKLLSELSRTNFRLVTDIVIREDVPSVNVTYDTTVVRSEDARAHGRRYVGFLQAMVDRPESIVGAPGID